MPWQHHFLATFLGNLQKSALLKIHKSDGIIGFENLTTMLPKYYLSTYILTLILSYKERLS